MEAGNIFKITSQQDACLHISDLSLLGKSVDIIIIFNTDGRYLYYRRSKNYEFLPDDVAMKNPFDFFDTDTATKIIDSIKKVVKTARALEKEDVIRRNGKTLYFLSRMCPIIDSSNRVVAVCQISHDITNPEFDKESMIREDPALHEECMRFEEILRLQRDLGEALSGAVDLKEALELILCACLQLDGIDCGGIYLVDNASGDLRLASHTRTGLPELFIDQGYQYKQDSFRARLVMEGRPIYTSYPRFMEESKEVYPMEDLRAIAILPVRGKKI
jgi:hypothetical protein